MAIRPQHKLLAQHYVITHNITKSAKLAGFPERSAASQGSEILKRPEVAAYVEQLLAGGRKKAELTAAKVLERISVHAFTDITRALNEDGALKPISQLPKSVRHIIQSIETDEIFHGRGSAKTKVGHTRKIKRSDPLRALELLAKHFKLLTEVHEDATANQPQVILTMPTNGSEAKDESK